jgi:phage shock protein PspC (stress-responsive transcriptional regulator)
MNKVTTINLNGNAYQLEEDGYEALRRYLDTASRRLEGNPDRDEIIADIEQSIADKFRAVLGTSKTVVASREVEAVIEEMGPVQDASASPEPAAGTSRSAGTPAPSPATPKRLYRIRAGSQFGGVCSGLAAYFNIDATFIRLAFVFMTIVWGSGLLLYVIMMIAVPWAETPSQEAAATGSPSTAEEFIRRAKEGYYEGMRAFGNRKAYREWKWKFRQEMRQQKRDFHREMRRNAQQWRESWHGHWAHPAQAFPPGWWFVSSVLGLMSFIITLLCWCSILSLIFTGTVFGLFLPAGIPLWLGIILLLIFFKLLKWPVKAMRYAFYYPGISGPGFFGPTIHTGSSILWLAVLAFALWVADSYSPHAHEAITHLRHSAHHVVDALREWWNRP